MKPYELLSTPALLEQLAEEASELAQAALKMSRILRHENPTPVTFDEASANLNEETADVLLVINELTEANTLNTDVMESVIQEQAKRWEKRLNEKEN